MTRDPFRELLALQEKMNRMFEESMKSRSADEPSPGVWSPAVDIYETDDSLIVKVELPEMRREDIEIRLENGVLTLRGERKLHEDLEKGACLCRECQYGPFSRTLSLPRAVDADRMQVHYKDGSLCLEIPKKEAPKACHVEIT